jgi:hypothetical protein
MADELRKGPSGPPAEDVDATVINDAIVAGEVPATRSNPGYVSRHVYVNAASTAIGGTYAGVTIEAAVALTVANLPPGNRFTIDVCPAGGSGSSGRACSGATLNGQGGAGGGGMAHNQAVVARADVLAAIAAAGGSLTMTIPLGPAGGAAVVDSSGVGTYPSSNPGTAGGQCSFGSLLTSFGGGGGGFAQGNPTGNVPAGGAGGGVQSVGGGSGGTTAPVQGGNPTTLFVLGVGNPNSGYGGADCLGTASAAGLKSAWGGASGGSGRNNEGVGGIGGDTSYGGAGGAAAATRNTLTAAPLNGSQGGCSNFPANSTRAAGGTGADGTTSALATAGAPGATGVYPFGGNGGGSGGDARASNVGSVATGGAGGAGGFPGGGGGGGGMAIVVGTGTATSGAGGRGGDGCIVLTGWY